MAHSHQSAGESLANERWLGAMWPFVLAELPDHPASILEIGCGPFGGFVPRLLRQGHQAVGVDPNAPDDGPYRHVEYERYEQPEQVDVVVASASLHHVADLSQVLDAVRASLTPQGRVIVVEWALERFDEVTSQWCFARLAALESNDEAGWLHTHRDQWLASGESWDAYLESWKKAGNLHDSEEVVRELDARFERRVFREGPFFFPDLADTTYADEQAAIDASSIQAACIQYSAKQR